LNWRDEKRLLLRINRETEVRWKKMCIVLFVFAILAGFVIGACISWRLQQRELQASENHTLYAGVTKLLCGLEPITQCTTDKKAYIATANKTTYTQQDLYWLSWIIMQEAGYVSEHTEYLVGSVVLNRVTDDRFPDNIKDVIFQTGQYYPASHVATSIEPDERAIEIAEDLLINGSILPECVIWQANFIQGDGIYEVSDGVYFCY